MGGVNVDDSDSVPNLLVSVTVCPDGSEHCTIYASEEYHRHRAAMWISASSGSFISLDEMR